MKAVKTENFLYTDGRDVVVTNTNLIVKNTRYLLKGILDFSLAIVRPQRLPGLLLTILALMFILNAIFQFVPYSFYNTLDIPDELIVSEVQLSIGIGMLIIGTASMLLVRKRYALRIETATEKKNVIVSRRKEYVDKILTAIRKAKLMAFGAK